MSMTRSTCGLDRRWLHYYLDGEFSPGEERVIERHVERCADCRRELGWLRATEAALTAVEVPVPPADFTARLMARAAAEGALIRPAADRSRLARVRRVTNQAMAGVRYVWQMVPEVPVPASWRARTGAALRRGMAVTGRGFWRVSQRLVRRPPEPSGRRASDMIRQGTTATGRGIWRASRQLLRRQRRSEAEPQRGRFTLPRLRLPGPRLTRQPSR